MLVCEGIVVKRKTYHLDKFFMCEIMPHSKDTLNYLIQDIEALEYLYPNIKSWYKNIFAQGLKNNEREVIFVREKSGAFAGFSLLKNTFDEKKICTFFILPEFRESGIGKKMLPIAMDLIGGKNVGITVSESVNSSLEPLLLKNSFTLDSEESGLYLPNSKELLYILK